MAGRVVDRLFGLDYRSLEQQTRKRQPLQPQLDPVDRVGLLIHMNRASFPALDLSINHRRDRLIITRHNHVAELIDDTPETILGVPQAAD